MQRFKRKDRDNHNGGSRSAKRVIGAPMLQAEREIQPQTKQRLNLGLDEADFRTSLILPALRKRFSLLRSEDGRLVDLDTMEKHLRAQRQTGRLTGEEVDAVMAQYRLQSYYEQIPGVGPSKAFQADPAYATPPHRPFHAGHSSTLSTISAASSSEGYTPGSTSSSSHQPFPYSTTSESFPAGTPGRPDEEALTAPSSASPASSSTSPAPHPLANYKRGGNSMFAGRVDPIRSRGISKSSSAAAANKSTELRASISETGLDQALKEHEDDKGEEADKEAHTTDESEGLEADDIADHMLSLRAHRFSTEQLFRISRVLDDIELELSKGYPRKSPLSEASSSPGTSAVNTPVKVRPEQEASPMSPRSAKSNKSDTEAIDPDMGPRTPRSPPPPFSPIRSQIPLMASPIVSPRKGSLGGHVRPALPSANTFGMESSRSNSPTLARHAPNGSSSSSGTTLSQTMLQSTSHSIASQHSDAEQGPQFADAEVSSDDEQEIAVPESLYYDPSMIASTMLGGDEIPVSAVRSQQQPPFSPTLSLREQRAGEVRVNGVLRRKVRSRYPTNSTNGSTSSSVGTNSAAESVGGSSYHDSLLKYDDRDSMFDEELLEGTETGSPPSEENNGGRASPKQALLSAASKRPSPVAELAEPPMMPPNVRRPSKELLQEVMGSSPAGAAIQVEDLVRIQEKLVETAESRRRRYEKRKAAEEEAAAAAAAAVKDDGAAEEEEEFPVLGSPQVQEELAVPEEVQPELEDEKEQNGLQSAAASQRRPSATSIAMSTPGLMHSAAMSSQHSQDTTIMTPPSAILEDNFRFAGVEEQDSGNGLGLGAPVELEDKTTTARVPRLAPTARDTAVTTSVFVREQALAATQALKSSQSVRMPAAASISPKIKRSKSVRDLGISSPQFISGPANPIPSVPILNPDLVDDDARKSKSPKTGFKFKVKLSSSSKRDARQQPSEESVEHPHGESFLDFDVVPSSAATSTTSLQHSAVPLVPAQSSSEVPEPSATLVTPPFTPPTQHTGDDEDAAGQDFPKTPDLHRSPDLVRSPYNDIAFKSPSLSPIDEQRDSFGTPGSATSTGSGAKNLGRLMSRFRGNRPRKASDTSSITSSPEQPLQRSRSKSQHPQHTPLQSLSSVLEKPQQPAEPVGLGFGKLGKPISSLSLSSLSSTSSIMSPPPVLDESLYRSAERRAPITYELTSPRWQQKVERAEPSPLEMPEGAPSAGPVAPAQDLSLTIPFTDDGPFSTPSERAVTPRQRSIVSSKHTSSVHRRSQSEAVPPPSPKLEGRGRSNSVADSLRRSVQDRPPTPPPSGAHRRKASESAFANASPVPQIPDSFSSFAGARSPAGLKVATNLHNGRGLVPPVSPGALSVRSARSSAGSIVYAGSVFDMYGSEDNDPSERATIRSEHDAAELGTTDLDVDNSESMLWKVIEDLRRPSTIYSDNPRWTIHSRGSSVDSTSDYNRSPAMAQEEAFGRKPVEPLSFLNRSGTRKANNAPGLTTLVEADTYAEEKRLLDLQSGIAEDDYGRFLVGSPRADRRA